MALHEARAMMKNREAHSAAAGSGMLFGVLHGDWSTKDVHTVPSDFKEAMRRLAAAVSAVTVRDGDEILGIAATAVCSLSMEPPSLLVSIRHDSSIMATLKAKKRFTVHILAEDQENVANAFAGRLGGSSRAAHVKWQDGEEDCDRVEGAIFHIDCEVCSFIEVFSHVVVVGTVSAAQAGQGEKPLVYFDGAYRGLSAASKR